MEYQKVLKILVGISAISVLIGCGSVNPPDIQEDEGGDGGVVISEGTTDDETGCDEVADECSGETADEGGEADEASNSDSENDDNSGANDIPDDQYSYEPDDSSANVDSSSGDGGNSSGGDDSSSGEDDEGDENDEDNGGSDSGEDDEGDTEDDDNGDDGGCVITLPVLDSFEGESLDTDLWILGRDEVVVEDGYLKIAPCSGCGGGAYVYSIDYEDFNLTKVKIEKRTMVMGSRETSFTINFTDNSQITIFYKKSGSQNSLPSNSFSMTTWPRFEKGSIHRRLVKGVWGEWFEESIEYDGNTGVIKYDFDNDGNYELVIDWVPGLVFKGVTGSAWNGTMDNVQKWDWIVISPSVLMPGP